jgi:hypothetical protein
LNIDAVNIGDREILFVHTKTDIQAWVFAEHPTLYVSWKGKIEDFKLSLSANNTKESAEPYVLNFNILDTNETIIKPTPDFNDAAVRKLGKIKAGAHDKTYNADIKINDTTWFEGNVLRYILNCTDC